MHYAPFDMLVDGEYQGIGRDLFDEIAKELGVKVEYIDLPWASILPGLEAGKFDIVNAPVTITAERTARYSFTLPIGNATVALVKKACDSSITKSEDIAGQPVGSQKGSAQLAQLKALSDSLPEAADIREYVNIDEALADLAAGRIKGVANSMAPEVFCDQWHALTVILAEEAIKLRGTLSAKHEIGRLKRGEFEELADPVALDLMRKIRSMLDPDARMNPGAIFDYSAVPPP